MVDLCHPGPPSWASPPARTEEGYFIVAGDGSVYAFGDAVYHGSRGGEWTNGAVVGMAVDAATGGYWILTANGAVYGEDAPDYGSPSRHPLASAAVAIAAAPGGTGYWVVSRTEPSTPTARPCTPRRPTGISARR